MSYYNCGVQKDSVIRKHSIFALCYTVKVLLLSCSQQIARQFNAGQIFFLQYKQDSLDVHLLTLCVTYIHRLLFCNKTPIIKPLYKLPSVFFFFLTLKFLFDILFYTYLIETRSFQLLQFSYPAPKVKIF